MTKTLASVQTHPVFSDEDYLEFERFAQEKHEFLDGSVYAMAGESPDHSTICFNLYGIIYNQLRRKNCRGYSPNMKVATNEGGLFSYPDLIIVCGKPVFLDEKGDVLTNPAVIFEVLSPSTENYDRGEKFLRYTNYIETLEDYVLVSQTKPLIEHYSKQDNSGWEKSEIAGLNAVLNLHSVKCEIPLSGLYDLIEFSA
ncbi:MAG: Uma2 family endonuclease [Blastocatellia bacterium]|nr:Uma2 family endonuclease [Blastocatellia bacterium]